MAAHHLLSPRTARTGFTLLEMSIVLAIIGLVVGGIMAGNTFVTNARLNALVSESRYYINAFNQFNNQYKAIPGDFSSASTWWPDFVKTPPSTPGADNGDGNGLIRAGAVAPNNGNAEIFGAFEHLALVGMIKGSYTGATAGAADTAVASPGVNIPQSTAENVGYVLNHADAADGNVSGDPVYFDGKYGHVLIVAGDTANALPNTGFLKPTQALQIDDKYDDGAPGKGWITTPNITASTCASDASTYNISSKDKLCYLIMNIPGS